MLKNTLSALMLLSCLLMLSGCEKDPLSTKGQQHLPDKQAAATDKQKTVIPKKTVAPVTEIGWDNLIPEEWLPDSDLVEKYNNGELGDDDPRIIALKKQVSELEKKAPVNKKLDGKIIKMPGFVVPVELDGEKVREFLLVPYHGACVHVPPPPANQTVYVKTNDQSAGKYTYFDTVWVTGVIRVIKTSSDIAESGYTIFATKVEPYE